MVLWLDVGNWRLSKALYLLILFCHQDLDTCLKTSQTCYRDWPSPLFAPQQVCHLSISFSYFLRSFQSVISCNILQATSPPWNAFCNGNLTLQTYKLVLSPPVFSTLQLRIPDLPGHGRSDWTLACHDFVGPFLQAFIGSSWLAVKKTLIGWAAAIHPRLVDLCRSSLDCPGAGFVSWFRLQWFLQCWSASMRSGWTSQHLMAQQNLVATTLLNNDPNIFIYFHIPILRLAECQSQISQANGMYRGRTDAPTLPGRQSCRGFLLTAIEVHSWVVCVCACVLLGNLHMERKYTKIFDGHYVRHVQWIFIITLLSEVLESSVKCRSRCGGFFVFVARKFLGRRLGGLFGFTTPWLLQRSRPSAVDRGAVVHYCWWLKSGNTWDTTKRLLYSYGMKGKIRNL